MFWTVLLILHLHYHCLMQYPHGMDERILNCQFDVHWQLIDSGCGFAVVIMTAAS